MRKLFERIVNWWKGKNGMPWPDISITQLWSNCIEVQIRDVGRFPQHQPCWWEWIHVDNYPHSEACAHAVEGAARRLQAQADTWQAEADEYSARQKASSDKIATILRRVRERQTIRK